MATVLIAGCGYVGSALRTWLASEGHVVWGLRRHPELLPPGIRPLGADLTIPLTLAALPPALDCVLYTAAAASSEDEAYRAIYSRGTAQPS